MTELHQVLDTIARALAPLHDDAFNPTHAIATPTVEVNEFTRHYLTRYERVTTHPGLRRPTGARTIDIPVGDPDAKRLYTDAADIITTAYRSLRPDVRTRGPADSPTLPDDLVSMLAVINRALEQLTLLSIVEHRLKPLRELKTKLQPWADTWTPEPDYPVCANPHRRWRCQGHPVIANSLCRSCYDHQRHLDNYAAQRHTA